MKKQVLTAIGALLLAGSLSAGAQVFVRIGPPPPARREVVPPPPRAGLIWQPGYHRWDGAHYVWMPGTYAAPPRPHARWVPGHWRNSPRGYLWVDGHWA